MIQRIQTVYLLLAAAFAALMFFLPVYGGMLQDGAIKNFMVGDSYPLFLVVILLVVICFVTVFLFKNRSLQKKLVLLGVLISVVTVVLVYINAGTFRAMPIYNFKEASYKAAAALPVLVLIMLFLAFGGIRKDEKLVRSVDRLR